MTSGILRAGAGQAAWVVGDHYTVKASGEDTGEAFALIEVLVPPQSGPPPHVHRREDEAFYVLEGEFEVHIDDQRLTAGPGSWVTLARGSLHHFRNIGSTPARMLILATPAGLDSVLPRGGPRGDRYFAGVRGRHARGSQEAPRSRAEVRDRDRVAAHGWELIGNPRTSDGEP
jgi:quercetin dioxygenase-like cupin family protein